MTEEAGVQKSIIGKNFIDLEAVIAGKNPMLLRVMPGFIVRYLKRVIHQDTINAALFRYRDLYGLDFVNAILDEFRARIIVEGLENIPPEGKVIIAGNHPLGGLDGMALMSVVGRIRKDVVFPVNDLLLNVPNLRELFIPINKHGSNAGNVRIIEETFASDKAVLYFPAGLCSRKKKGRIMDLEWKKSFVTKARKHERSIVPVFISGRNSNFFYNLANFRAGVGIRQNIEMLYLVDEMYKQRDQEIRIVLGRMVPASFFTRELSDRQWADLLRDHVYQLENEPQRIISVKPSG